MTKRTFPIQLESLHHAYCIEGDRGAVCAELFDFIESDLKIERSGNPDFYHEAFESLGIDDARRLSDLQSNRAFYGKRIFVIEIGSMTTEAQNALLKLFEEPSPETHFFLLMRSAEALLPTLRSRLFVIRGEGGNQQGHAEAKAFLAMSIAERFAHIKALADDIADEKKSREDAVKFLDSLEELAGERLKKNPSAEEAETARTILWARAYIADRSASVKMILDACAIALPLPEKGRV